MTFLRKSLDYKMAWLCYYKTLLPLFEGVKYLYNILIKSIYKEHPTGCHKHGTNVQYKIKQGSYPDNKNCKK